MKKKNWILIYSLSSFIVLAGIIVAIIGWLNTPVVETLDVTSITSTTAKCGGKVKSKGKFDRIFRSSYGLCWDTSAYPGINNNKLNCSLNEINMFNGTLTNLELDKLYHVRAFATRFFRTSYGQDKTFIANDYLTDFDGNRYRTVKIGDQTWMAENLRVTHYRNGDSIPNITDGETWRNQPTGAYCNYDNNINNSTIYGRLYNWYAITDSRNIAPSGWHVPTEQEWLNLFTYLTNNDYACEVGCGTSDIGKSMAARTGWANCDIAGSVGNDQASNNRSGFSALPGGFRQMIPFHEADSSSYLWSSTAVFNDTYRAVCWTLMHNSKKQFIFGGDKKYGLSVRLIKD